MNKGILLKLIVINALSICQNHTSAQPNPFVDAEIIETLRLVNVARKLSRLDTVTLSATLSSGCHKHAQYLGYNKNNPLTKGLNAHNEHPTLYGYTKEGEKAGKASDIHYIFPGYAIDDFLASFYHRIPLLQPDLKEIGIGYFNTPDDKVVVTVLDCVRGIGETDNYQEIVVLPEENQTNVPLRMGNEIPNPTPEKIIDCGYPITIYFANQQTVQNVAIELKNRLGQTIPLYVSTPQQPATAWNQWNTICAIAQNPLQPKQKYTVNLTCVVDGINWVKKWSFYTVLE